jgi:cytochrome c peroxidase
MRKPHASAISAMLLLTISATSLVALPAASQGLPPVPFPIENPLTPEKAILGKILFWDQQLSTDETIACGSCHAIGAGGTEATPAPHPGPDGLFGNSDDQKGSLGVRRRDMNRELVDDPLFGFEPQVTGRAAPNYFGGLWAPELLLDGRAGDEFRDPLTGDVIIPTGGALETQSLMPILNDVEMSTPDWTWADVVNRIATSQPLRRATNLTPDIVEAVATFPSYPALFNNAFGDPQITPVRIAFAIASYERTLVSDQTAWDAFIAGDSTALSEAEEAGWNAFLSVGCDGCHPPPLFTDNSFRNIGLRDPAEDNGREAITGDPADRGRFKVPTLRNVTLHPDYTHTGEIGSASGVIALYLPGAQASTENIDPMIPIALTIEDRISIVSFLVGGLVDLRVQNELPPFDRPDLAPVPVPEIGGTLGLWIGVGVIVGLRRVRRLPLQD